MKYFIITLVFILFSHSKAEITFKSNGYEGIQIIIEDGTPENTDLIEKIIKMFEAGSEYMYNATNGLAYFRKASIVIPKDWKISRKYNVEHIYNEIPYSMADIRVGKANEYYTNTPYTLQPGGCFDSGKYIHFTPEYLLDKDGKIKQLYGDAGRQLVHEWAHFRYGVFDENGITGSKRFPPFYVTGNKFAPISCNKNVVGYMQGIDGENQCYVDDQSGVPINCVFTPDIKENAIQSSIMYLPNILSVTDFCDDSNKLKHNSEAPSQQNILCNYLPTWNVIHSHSDFKNSVLLHASKMQDFQFSILQPMSHNVGRYVIVADSSGSMSDTCMKLDGEIISRTECVNMALKRFIKLSIPDGSYLGLVQFRDKSKSLMEMTKVTDSNREKLSNKKFPNGAFWTNITDGLLKGIELLKSGNKSAEGGTLILLSDGLDSRLELYINELVKYKTVIHSIGLGESASVTMAKFVERTGGKTFFMSNKTKNLKHLDLALKNMVVQNEENTSIEILVESIKIVKNVLRTSEVFIDSSLGKETKFQFSSMSENLNKTVMNLISPNGTSVRVNAVLYTELKQKIFTIRYAESGLWKVKIISPFDVDVLLMVSSKKVYSNSVPITSNCWLDSVNVDLSKRSYIRIFCQVSQGYNAVIKANVEAHIEAINGSVFTTELHDDGAGADVIEEDGIYSAYVIDFISDNRYTISVKVTGLNDTTVAQGTRSSSSPKTFKVNKTKKSRSKFPISEFIKSKDKRKMKLKKYIGKFQRFVLANSFIVNNFAKFNKEMIAPAKVTDLKVIKGKQFEDSAIVKLQWTSSGNKLDIGQAKEVLIYYAETHEALRNLTKQAFLVEDSQVIHGSLKNVPKPHKLQVVELEFKNMKKTSIFFAVQTLSYSGNISNLSNIVQASFIEIPFGHYVDTTPNYEVTTSIYNTLDTNSTNTYRNLLNHTGTTISSIKTTDKKLNINASNNIIINNINININNINININNININANIPDLKITDGKSNKFVDKSGVSTEDTMLTSSSDAKTFTGITMSNIKTKNVTSNNSSEVTVPDFKTTDRMPNESVRTTGVSTEGTISSFKREQRERTKISSDGKIFTGITQP